MPRVVHFEIVGEKPEDLVKFYSDVFDWKVQKWEGPMDYWLIQTGEEGEPGIDGGLGKRTEPGESTTNTIDVEDVDDFIAKVEQSGFGREKGLAALQNYTQVKNVAIRLR